MFLKIANKLDTFFQIKKSKSTITTELIAGITTFTAMSYILIVNPSILANTGIDKGVLISTTALAATIGCFLMSFIANMPIALAPTMGSNAFLSFVVCVSMGLTWQEAFGLVFYNGLFFLLISITGIRGKLIEAVPSSLKIGLQAGIGFFIAYLGLQSGKLLVSDSNAMGALAQINMPETLFTLGGLTLMSILFSRKVYGSFLISIIIMTIIGFFVLNSDGSKISNIPDKIVSMPTSIAETLFQLDLLYPFENFKKAIPVIITLLIVDIFDTLATTIALGKEAGFIDKDGKFPKVGKVFLADSLATISGALLGTSTTGSYIESSTGIHSGGRTGLTSFIVGILFLVSLFFSPIINIIPAQATAPALIIVGILMLKSIKDLDFKNFTEFMPAILCMMMITITFKITEGFAFGMISYVILMIASKRAKELKISTLVLFTIMALFLYFA